MKQGTRSPVHSTLWTEEKWICHRDLLPLAIGVALSPVPIIAVILMLFSQNARSTSLGFLIGWFLGLAVVASLIIFVADPAQQSTGGAASPLSAVVHLVLWAVAFFLAYPNWRKHPGPGEPAEMPKWMSGVDHDGGQSIGAGGAAVGGESENLTLTVAGGVVISGAGLNATQTVVALVVYILVASVSVAAPVVVNLVLGERAAPTLNGWKELVGAQQATVMTLLFLVFGFVLLGKGLGALIGG